MKTNLLIKSLLSSSLILSSSNLFASKQLTFETEILPVCGIVIDKAKGAIQFSDTINNDIAKFSVKTNSSKRHADISFKDITTTRNIENKDGYFQVGQQGNSKKEIQWNSPTQIKVKHDEEQEIVAIVPQNSNSIIAGTARVTTVLEVSCN